LNRPLARTVYESPDNARVAEAGVGKVKGYKLMLSSVLLPNEGKEQGRSKCVREPPDSGAALIAEPGMNELKT
jgi:hypothetical protein